MKPSDTFTPYEKRAFYEGVFETGKWIAIMCFTAAAIVLLFECFYVIPMVFE